MDCRVRKLKLSLMLNTSASMMTGLSCGGLFISAMMWRKSGSRDLPGCGEGSGCEQVTSSRWSKWLGLPVSAPATAVYLLLTVLLALSHSRIAIVAGTPVVAVNFATGLLLGGTAVWFMWLQWQVIRRFCAYCTVLHVIGMCICVLTALRVQAEPLPRHLLIIATVGAAAGLVMLIAGQVLVTPKLYVVEIAPPVPVNPTPAPAVDSSQPQRDARQISVLNGAVKLDVNSWPCLGSPEARHMVVCLFDYTCPTCRQTHGFVSEAVERYAGQLAVVLLPVPMDPTCNRHLSKQHHLHAHACKYARLALLVWQANPAVYEEFDRWVFQDVEPPLIGVAIQKVRELLKTDDVDPARPDRDVDLLIFEAIDWYRQIKTERIPTFLFANASLRGQLPSTVELCRILENEYLGLRAAISDNSISAGGLHYGETRGSQSSSGRLL